MRDSKQSRCIICGEMKPGLDVNDDIVIRTIRQAKQVLKMPTGYHLVVCKHCYPAYYKGRKSYERRRLLYVGLGVLLVLALFLATFSAVTVVYGIGIIVFMYLLSLLTYMPSLNVPTKAGK